MTLDRDYPERSNSSRQTSAKDRDDGRGESDAESTLAPDVDPWGYDVDAIREESEKARWMSRPPMWALALSLFYTVIVGLVIGKVIIKTYHGSKGQVTQTITPIASSQSYSMFGSLRAEDKLSIVVSIHPLMPQAEHAKEYTLARLADFGLDAKLGLLRVEIKNLDPSESGLALTDDPGTLEIEDANGVVKSLALPSPDTIQSEKSKLLLTQRKLTGIVPPNLERTGWKLMERPVDLATAKRGRMTFADGRILELESAAFGR